MTVRIKIHHARLEPDQIYHLPGTLITTIDPWGNWGVQMGAKFKQRFQDAFRVLESEVNKDESEAEVHSKPVDDDEKPPIRLEDGQADIFVSNDDLEVAPAFEKVILVRDFGNKPLDQLVGAALLKAEEAGLTSVTLPLLRTDRRSDSEDYRMALLRAALIFRGLKFKTSLQEIQIVVYQDDASVNFLYEELDRTDSAERQNKAGYVVN